MPDINKVIKGLEACINGGSMTPGCEKCPYATGHGTCTNIDALLQDALELLKAMWRDLQKSKSCRICANWYKCDPNDDGRKWQFWVSCGGSCKLNWEWQGVNEVKENET